MAKDFTSSIEGTVNIKKEINIKEQHQTSISNFKIGKKKEDKKVRKSIPFYLDDDLLKKVDAIAKKTNYNRNELLTKMVEFCVNNLEYEF